MKYRLACLTVLCAWGVSKADHLPIAGWQAQSPSGPIVEIDAGDLGSGGDDVGAILESLLTPTQPLASLLYEVAGSFLDRSPGESADDLTPTVRLGGVLFDVRPVEPASNNDDSPDVIVFIEPFTPFGDVDSKRAKFELVTVTDQSNMVFSRNIMMAGNDDYRFVTRHICLVNPGFPREPPPPIVPLPTGTTLAGAGLAIAGMLWRRRLPF